MTTPLYPGNPGATTISKRIFADPRAKETFVEEGAYRRVGTTATALDQIGVPGGTPGKKNRLNPVHPVWCLRGPDCASGLHFSGLACAAPRGDEVIQVAAGLWQMDVGPVSPGGVLLEFSADDDDSHPWFIDLAQSRALIRLMRTATRSAAHALPLPPMFGTYGNHGKGQS